METPQVGDVWQHGRTRRHVTAVTIDFIEYEYRDTAGAQARDAYRLHPRWFLEGATLVEHGGRRLAETPSSGR